MKNIFRFQLVLLVFVSTVVFSQTDLKKYDYESNHFSIDFCQEPEISIDTTEGINTLYWEVDVSDSLHANVYYSVSIEEYEADFIHSDSAIDVVEGFINSTQNSLLEDAEYSLLTSTMVELNGYPGKQFKWKSNLSDVGIIFQVYLVNNMLYQLSLVTKDGYMFNTDIDKFFNSFMLIGIPNGNYAIAKKEYVQICDIKFPDTPVEQHKLLDSELGKLDMYIHLLEPKGKSDNLVYVSMETQYPEGSVNTDAYSLNSMYQASIKNSLSTVNGEIITITDIYYDSYLGKEYKSYFSEGQAIMVHRVFFINDVMYLFGSITTPENVNNKQLKKFLDSFEIRKESRM